MELGAFAPGSGSCSRPGCMRLPFRGRGRPLSGDDECLLTGVGVFAVAVNAIANWMERRSGRNG